MPAIEDKQAVRLTPAVVSLPPKSRFSPRTLWVAVAIGSLFLLLATAVWFWMFPKDQLTYTFVRLDRGSIASTVAATGTCNAVVDVMVGSQVSGNIKALYADFNTRVKAGQLVALIDPEMFEARVKQANAAYRNALASLESAKAAVQRADADVYSAKAAAANQVASIARTKIAVADARTKLVRRQKMFNEEILSKEDLDTAQATLDEAVAEQQAAEAQHDAAVHNIQSAEAALNAANKNVSMMQAEVELTQASLNQTRIDLDHTRITAPVDGVVVARRMDVGQTVAASFQAPTIFEIAQDLTKMQVDTNVAESDVGRVRVGQRATFTVDAFPGLVFRGEVTQLRQAPINVQNVITYDTVIQVSNPDLKLFPGMTANVTILVSRSDNALRIPNAALRVKLPAGSLERGTQPPVKPAGPNWTLVYVAEPNSLARAVPVRLGITDGNFTEILEGGLQENQSVIVSATAPTAGRTAAGAPATSTGGGGGGRGRI